MTTIVAVTTAKGVKFAWDSQTTWQYRAMLGAVKVFQNGPVTFGVAGLGRALDVLKYMGVPDRKEYEPDFDNEAWIVRSLVPAIIKEFKGVDVGESDSFSTEAHAIISVGGDTGYLSGNLSFVRDESGTYAVGSGSQYALGALSAGASPKKAVEIARDWDLYTGGDIKEMTV